MKIENLKELQRLIKLCRQTGVEAIEVDGVKMNLGPTPVIHKYYKSASKTSKDTINTIAPGGITEEVKITTDGLTDEQLLMWSAQGPDQQ